jgi:hypothetical protein
MQKYIKITEKDKKPIIILVANKAFYEKRGARIEEPTQKEIEAFFPEERKGKTTETKQALTAASAELEREKTAHAETKQALAAASAELEKVKSALEEAQKQITKLSKKE